MPLVVLAGLLERVSASARARARAAAHALDEPAGELGASMRAAGRQTAGHAVAAPVAGSSAGTP